MVQYRYQSGFGNSLATEATDGLVNSAGVGLAERLDLPRHFILFRQLQLDSLS